MDQIFQDFGETQHTLNGYLLATTISPEPASDPARLYSFLRSTNAHNVHHELRHRLQNIQNLRLDKKEVNAWLEVFSVFYKVASRLVAAEEASNAGQTNNADWSGVYEVWKEFVNALYKGYQANLFGAWTIPCLYVAGKYLRVFAIKADENSASQRDSGIAFGGIQEEDVLNPDSKNEKLEDAARQINRIFGLCISDRYVLRL